MKYRRGRRNTFSLFSFQDIITSVTGIMILITLMMAVDLIQRHEKSPRVHTAQLSERLKDQLAQTLNAINQLKEKIELQNQETLPDGFLDESILENKLSEIQDSRKRADNDSEEIIQVKLTTDHGLVELKKKEAEQQPDMEELEKVKKEVAQKTGKIKKLQQGKRLIYNPVKGASKTPWLVDVTDSTVTVARLGVVSTPQNFSNYLDFEQWISRLSPASNYCMVVLRPSSAKSYEKIFIMLDRQNLQYGYDAIGDKETVIDPQDGAGI